MLYNRLMSRDLSLTRDEEWRHDLDENIASFTCLDKKKIEIHLFFSVCHQRDKMRDTVMGNRKYALFQF